MAVKGLEKDAPFWVLHKVEVWADRGSAFYTTEHVQQPGSGGQFAMCPLSTCTPNRAVGHWLEPMAKGERV